jgi:hypothetical protein
MRIRECVLLLRACELSVLRQPVWPTLKCFPAITPELRKWDWHPVFTSENNMSCSTILLMAIISYLCSFCYKKNLILTMRKSFPAITSEPEVGLTSGFHFRRQDRVLYNFAFDNRQLSVLLLPQKNLILTTRKCFPALTPEPEVGLTSCFHFRR